MGFHSKRFCQGHTFCIRIYPHQEYQGILHNSDSMTKHSQGKNMLIIITLYLLISVVTDCFPILAFNSKFEQIMVCRICIEPIKEGKCLSTFFDHAGIHIKVISLKICTSRLRLIFFTSIYNEHTRSSVRNSQ